MKGGEEMSLNRRHFRTDLTDKKIIAEVQTKSGEKRKWQVYDLSKQGVSFYINDFIIKGDWEGSLRVKFCYNEKEYDFGMKFVRIFDKDGKRMFGGEFDGKDKLKMSRLSLELMKEKLSE